MALTLVGNASHTDHGLTQDQLNWLLAQFTDREAFFIATLELPEHLGTLPCGLHGPVVGDAPVLETEVLAEAREPRTWPSRTCDRPVRQTRTITVIGGPHEEHACVLYTAYGGPAAPREVADPYIESEEERAASRVFWAEHALSR